MKGKEKKKKKDSRPPYILIRQGDNIVWTLLRNYKNSKTHKCNILDLHGDYLTPVFVQVVVVNLLEQQRNQSLGAEFGFQGQRRPWSDLLNVI